MLKIKKKLFPIENAPLNGSEIKRIVPTPITHFESFRRNDFKTSSQFSREAHLDKMSKLFLVNLLFLLCAVNINAADNHSKVICYYDSRAFAREGE